MYGMLFLALALKEVELRVEAIASQATFPPDEQVPFSGIVLGVATERLKALYVGCTYYGGKSSVLQSMREFAPPELHERFDTQQLFAELCRDIAATLFVLEVQKTLRPYRDIEAGRLGMCAGWKVVYVPHQRRR